MEETLNSIGKRNAIEMQLTLTIHSVTDAETDEHCFPRLNYLEMDGALQRQMRFVILCCGMLRREHIQWHSNMLVRYVH